MTGEKDTPDLAQRSPNELRRAAHDAERWLDSLDAADSRLTVERIRELDEPGEPGSR